MLLALDLAHFLLDRGVDQHALDLGLLGGGADEGGVGRRPGLRIEVLAVGGDQAGGRHRLALLSAQAMARHRHEPDVDVEADLMAHMAEGQRAAARLRHVADQDAVPAGGLGGERREALQEPDQFGMAPVAVARQAHHLPVSARRPAVRRRLQTAAAGNSRSRATRPVLGSFLAREQIFGRLVRSISDLVIFGRFCGSGVMTTAGFLGRRRRGDHGLRRLRGCRRGGGLFGLRRRRGDDRRRLLLRRFGRRRFFGCRR